MFRNIVAIRAVIGGVSVGLVLLFGISVRKRWHLEADLSASLNRVEELNREILAKTAEIQRLETQLAPFKTIALQRFADPEPEALRKLADRISNIEDAVEPRTLSDQHKVTLRKLLEPLPNKQIHIVSRMMDGEGKDFATELADVFRAAGWEAHLNDKLTENPTGLGVCSYKSEKKLPGHDAMREVFLKAGFDCKDVHVGDNKIPWPQDANVLLVVGRRK